jgi:hypothetical protein
MSIVGLPPEYAPGPEPFHVSNCHCGFASAAACRLLPAKSQPGDGETEPPLGSLTARLAKYWCEYASDSAWFGAEMMDEELVESSHLSEDVEPFRSGVKE